MSLQVNLDDIAKRFDAPVPEDRLNEHIGRFYITLEMIREHPEKVAVMLKGVVVVMAQAMIAYDMIEYHGFHPDFRVAPMGRDIPEYKCYLKDLRNAQVAEEEPLSYQVIWQEVGPDGMTVSELSGEEPQ